jgi:hypothetical protein
MPVTANVQPTGSQSHYEGNAKAQQIGNSPQMSPRNIKDLLKMRVRMIAVINKYIACCRKYKK